MTGTETIGELFAGPGARDYLGEPVSIGEHMRQAGALAEAAGAPPGLVAAALLHDVGHLLGRQVDGPLGGPGGAPPGKTSPEDRHGESGAGWLSQWFGPEVTEPVRLHVAAKRYLCAVDPGYFGPMNAAEVAAFGAVPYSADAVAVRRWDDQAKDPGTAPPPFAHFAPLLAALAAR